MVTRGLWAAVVLGLASACALTQEPAPPRRAVPVDDAPFDGRFKSLDRQWQIAWQREGQQHVLAARDLIYWGAYQDAYQHSQILLADGGVLQGDVLQVSGESLVVYGEWCGETKLPLSLVKGIVLDPPPDAGQRDRLAAGLRAVRGTEDQLWLSNGDVVSGTLKGWRREANGDLSAGITLVTSGRDLTVSADTVLALALNPALVGVPPTRGVRAELGFRDGSLLQVTQVQIDGQATRLTLPGGLELRAAADALPNELTWLRPLGERVTYISDLPAVGYKHIPFLETTWPLQVDRNVAGGQLRSGGHVFSKGLGMHSTSRVAYELGRQYRKFQAELALDDGAGRRGSVTYRVLLQDAQGNWQRAYESTIVRGGMRPLPITVEVTNAQRLALIVELADQGDVLDHANWLLARLLK
jgi:hypothetical protein